MTEIYLPTLSHWIHRNPWTGSIAPHARYQVLPRKEEDILDATMWRGPLRLELSEPLTTAQFPISNAGIQGLKLWLAEQCDLLNSQSEPD